MLLVYFSLRFIIVTVVSTGFEYYLMMHHVSYLNCKTM